MDTSYNEIAKVLQDYFDGFYASDVAKLQGVLATNFTSGKSKPFLA